MSDMNKNQTTYSLEYLEQLKAEKKEQLEKSQEKMAELTRAIMAPPATNNNMELWMHYASNGMAAYKGLITCIKLYKRLKGTFSDSKKKKSKGFFS